MVLVKHRPALTLLFLILLTVVANTSDADEVRQYTFAWPYADESEMAPRGGTTRGPELTLDSNFSQQWQALTEPGIPLLERDRRAILAMQGGYRASFDFIETHGFTPDYEPPQPYQSWGTEYVYVIADEPRYISLQHILVMVVAMPDGTSSEPHVVKHWRQDWRHEDRDLYEYQGHNTWAARKLSRQQVRGTWSQAVFQVDDSPRYESYGKWSHAQGVSSWISAETWRPLPRREFSVRDDYQVLVGTNRHTITPTGWVHEEANKKTISSDVGVATSTLAVEAGLNRYERIIDFDFSPGRDYWLKTQTYWQSVHQAWQDIFARASRLTIEPDAEGQSMISRMFEEALASENKNANIIASEVRETLSTFLREDS